MISSFSVVVVVKEFGVETLFCVECKPSAIVVECSLMVGITSLFVVTISSCSVVVVVKEGWVDTVL